MKNVFSFLCILLVAVLSVSMVFADNNRDNAVDLSAISHSTSTANATATANSNAMAVNINENSNRTNVKNSNNNVFSPTTSATAVNSGVSNTTTVGGDSYFVPVAPEPGLEIPHSAPLPDSVFNPNDDGLILSGMYSVKGLKASIGVCYINWIWNKTDVIYSFKEKANKNTIAVVTVPRAVKLIDANSGIYSFNGKRYLYNAPIVAKGNQDIPSSILCKVMAYKAAMKGGDLLVITSYGFNIGGKSMGYNLFGTGVKVGSDSSIAGGGGIGPSYTSRYFECGIVGQVFKLAE